ncbi:TIGR03619 family F420-dependent LLM class oxidoreductase [Conexibacter sp. CPCC 206217]|uniref:TIGR03619 family F420-dependent LLM class oxidoreductase n=1 Tax=Conexibacter sp. CPCC 206217 TaxID=3064574 RepID=UPI00272782F5|nr:TIGR03619 family F420-dependent LLM class oxidoreductase [Conexibacter sp. CPCC 206217]MDO8212242.1 TIGR03619 family F420-dependent LLM class oxidoreductase [Conexibacter sp. CPCC 206217]
MTFELGLHLSNAHPQARAADVVALASAAEEAGFDAVWATEHVVVGPDAAAAYGHVVHPLPLLAFIAARTRRVALGTSVLVAPLHDPFLLAKQAADLQQLSGGRLRLGLGVGWHADEFRFMNVPFAGRGRRTDEAIAVMRALWAGTPDFHGALWQFEQATFGPLPEPPPQIWIGGASQRAAARALALGATWHPILLGADDVARAKARWPQLRIVPRVSAPAPPQLVEAVGAMRAAGADGVAAGLTVAPAEALRALEQLAGQL